MNYVTWMSSMLCGFFLDESLDEIQLPEPNVCVVKQRPSRMFPFRPIAVLHIGRRWCFRPTNILRH
jgi:hypothetical protein